jgi:hypothetical protein
MRQVTLADIFRNMENAVAKGIFKTIRELFMCCIFAWILLWLFNMTTFGRDSTDPSYGSRSGFSIKTDAFTGCQYLDSSHGLTPRLDRNGKQICNIKED